MHWIKSPAVSCRAFLCVRWGSAKYPLTRSEEHERKSKRGEDEMSCCGRLVFLRADGRLSGKDHA
jgi:hypothetical protein